jgi:hypothetical protein
MRRPQSRDAASIPATSASARRLEIEATRKRLDDQGVVVAYRDDEFREELEKRHAR